MDANAGGDGDRGQTHWHLPTQTPGHPTSGTEPQQAEEDLEELERTFAELELASHAFPAASGGRGELTPPSQWPSGAMIYHSGT
eukprot:255992-Rhodomonas_salina.1